MIMAKTRPFGGASGEVVLRTARLMRRKSLEYSRTTESRITFRKNTYGPIGISHDPEGSPYAMKVVRKRALFCRVGLPSGASWVEMQRCALARGTENSSNKEPIAKCITKHG